MLTTARLFYIGVAGSSPRGIQKTSPFQHTKETIDVMAVDNLPNELPCDAAEYFGLPRDRTVIMGSRIDL